MTRQIILSAALMHGLGNQAGAWRVRKEPASDFLSPHYYAHMARKAEEGKLHVLFLAEQAAHGGSPASRPIGSMDTVSVLSFMAAVTSKVGLVGTGSTTYNTPFDLARRFSTLDHLANGRVGWNSVTSAIAQTGAQFGITHPEAEDRYARADEFIDVVAALWESWEAGALVDDKVNGIFADPAKIHEINHVGPHFSVQGPLSLPRSRQGRPVIFHAGSSPPGRDQAARCADVVFTAQHTLEGAKQFRADIRARAEAYGRDPDRIKVTPGINMVLGRTLTEAEDRKAAIDNAQSVEEQIRRLSALSGLDVGMLRDNLDKPLPVDQLPSDARFNSGTGWRQSMIDLATKENLTVRQLLSRSPSGHHHVIGTAEMVADAMMERLEAGAADGFTMMVDILPSGLDDIVDLLVPELQRRGIFRRDYEHELLRDSLGIGEALPIPRKLPRAAVASAA